MQGPTIIDAETLDRDHEIERITAKRDQGLWYVVAGIGLLFAGSISTAFSIGGVLSVGFGVLQYGRHSIRLARRREDPWKDPELDQWEEEHYGDGEGGDAEGESIVNSDPDSAWGGKLR